jgi:polar amino acid transport system substrate-binding protein
MSENGPLPLDFVGRAQPRILLADDNVMLRSAMKGLLTNLGYTVDVASNGQEAVDAAAQREYGVVMLDIQMPEMDGFQAARLIRSDGRGQNRTWIVGLSAEGNDGVSLEAAGMDAYLTKPLRIAELIDILGKFRLGRGRDLLEG